MRFFIRFLVFVCTLLCFGRSSRTQVNQTEVDALWKEAEACYRKQLLNSTINGASSRPRRHTRSTPESEKMDENNHIYSIFEKMVMKKHKLTKRQAAGSVTPASCQLPVFNCNGADQAKYRNFDGSCNNLNYPSWGTRNTPFTRVTPVGYEDGFNAPRGRMNSYLPNPRMISTTVHFDHTQVNQHVTNMLPQFGQFLDHDMTLTTNANARCCANPLSNINCWSIPVFRNDPFYSTRSVPQRCLDFSRSTSCTLGGIRQQLNGITAFIDGSQIYGSDEGRNNQLRTFQGGLLITNSDPSLKDFLPSGQQVGLNGNFAAGDDRINEMPDLVVLHNVFIMEHNRIAKEFQQLLGSTDDTLIFQETRRVMIALLQNVVYTEYLPIILGDKAMTQFRLTLPSANQGWSSYNAGSDPSIYNSFATAAYRFGHSMVAGNVKLVETDDTIIGSFDLADNYLQSAQVTQSNGKGYDLIVRSLMTQNAPEMDRYCTDDVSNFLLKQPNQDFGSDLIARNIHRGRDHGLPSYNAFRQLCGLPTLSSWDNRPADIDEEGWNAAKIVYFNNYNLGPDQLDFFVGGLLEIPSNGGVTGPTFQCIMAAQFQRLKEGDRYFYTHNAGSYSFSQNQINEIRNQRLSDIVCRNSHQTNAPFNAFLVSSASNPRVDCSSRTRLNLRAFI